MKATDKQIKYLRFLNKHYTNEQLDSLNKKDASELISTILKAFKVRYNDWCPALFSLEERLFGESVSDKHYAWL